MVKVLRIHFYFTGFQYIITHKNKKFYDAL